MKSVTAKFPLTFPAIDFDVSVSLALENVSRNSCRQRAQISHQTLVTGVQSEMQLQRLAIVEATTALLTDVLSLGVNVLL